MTTVEYWAKLARKLPLKDEALLRKLFSSMDANGNGFLSPTEVERALEKHLGKEAEDFLHDQVRAPPRPGGSPPARI